jgi:hypothetical protein
MRPPPGSICHALRSWPWAHLPRRCVRLLPGLQHASGREVEHSGPQGGCRPRVALRRTSPCRQWKTVRFWLGASARVKVYPVISKHCLDALPLGRGVGEAGGMRVYPALGAERDQGSVVGNFGCKGLIGRAPLERRHHTKFPSTQQCVLDQPGTGEIGHPLVECAGEDVHVHAHASQCADLNRSLHRDILPMWASWSH